MAEQKEKAARIRKQYSQSGSSQKMMAFRLDGDLVEWLGTKPNKGRYINNLIRADKEQGGGR